MKRRVNECGEHAGPLRRCVSLISGWWEAVWGRDGAHYYYGTLRTPCEALFLAAFFSVNNTAGKQRLKGNHYPNKKKNNKKTRANSQRGSLVLYVILLNERDTRNFFLCHILFSPLVLQFLSPTPHIFSVCVSTLQLESSILSVLYVLSYMFCTLSPPLPISVSSSARRFLSGSLCEELGRRATWWALTCESVRVERNERTDSPHFRERGRQGAVAKS